MNTEKNNSYSPGEELANSITHGIGVFLGIAVLVILVVFSAMRKSAWEVVSCAVYGATFILLYLGSTLYHSARKPRTRKSSGGISGVSANTQWVSWKEKYFRGRNLS